MDTYSTKWTLATMGGECHIVGVAGTTPTLPLPYKLLNQLSLLATPKIHQKHAKPCFGHTNFGQNAPPMLTLDKMLHPCSPPKWVKHHQNGQARAKQIITKSAHRI